MQFSRGEKLPPKIQITFPNCKPQSTRLNRPADPSDRLWPVKQKPKALRNDFVNRLRMATLVGMAVHPNRRLELASENSLIKLSFETILSENHFRVSHSKGESQYGQKRFE